MRPIKNSIIALFAMLSIGCAHKESDEIQISDVQVIVEAQFADTDADTVATAKATRATTTAFESGDMLGLYAVKSGGELSSTSNLINNHQLKVTESGAITGSDLPAYYPDKSSSLDLFSYYPYQSGNATADALGVLVGIRTTQTDFSSLQASDVCYGRKLDAAPSAAPHPLQFSHSFAQLRLNFSLYEGCSAIAAVKLLSIKDSAKLNLQTGVVTLLTSSVVDVDPLVNSALSYTAIIPAQSLSGACVEITLTDGTIYYYHATTPIALKESATNTLNLSIVDKKVITASGAPAITAWNAVSSSGTLGESVNNLITLYWLAPHASYASIDKITVSVVDLFNQRREIEVIPAIDPLSSAEYATITFPLTIADAGYPQIIESIKLYSGATLIRNSPRAAILGSILSRAGAHTIGLNLTIEITPQEDWLGVANTAQTRAITVATIGTTKWTATATGAGLTVTPQTGTSGQIATISWAAQLTTGDSPARQGAVSFVTDPTGASQTITTSQVMGPYYLAVNPASAWAVANTAQTRSHTVSTGNLAGWTVAATGAGLSVAPASGTNGQAAVATWEANSVVGALARSGSVTFSPNPASTAAPITFSTTQQAGPAPALTLSSYAPGVTVPKAGGTYYTNVVSNFAWTASALTNVSLSPTTGSAGTTSVTITVPTTSLTTTRTVSTIFTTNAVPSGTTATAAQTWSGTQESARPPAPAGSVDINNLYWKTTNVGATTPQGYGTLYTWAAALAACKSLGKDWRLPNKDEFGTVSQYSAWTQLNGVNGRWFGPTSGWSSSNAIFFPAAGCRINGSLYYVGTDSYYWSSTEHNSSNAYHLYLFSSYVTPQDSGGKTHEFTVRCVQ